MCESCRDKLSDNREATNVNQVSTDVAVGHGRGGQRDGLRNGEGRSRGKHPVRTAGDIGRAVRLRGDQERAPVSPDSLASELHQCGNRFQVAFQDAWQSLTAVAWHRLRASSLLFCLVASGCFSAPPRVTIAALNIANGAGSEWNTPAIRARQAALLASVRPDIVILSEVDVNCVRSQRVDTAAEVLSLLPPGVILFASETRDSPELGCLIGDAFYISGFLSIVEHGELQLPQPPNDPWPRVAIDVRLTDRVGRELRIIGTHLSSGDQAKYRGWQLEGLADNHPDVVAGDLNALHDEVWSHLPGMYQATPDSIDSVWSLLPAVGRLVPTVGASDHDYMAVSTL